MEKWGLETVPLLARDYQLPETIYEVLTTAEGISELNPSAKQVPREGLVFRNAERTVSFKAISNVFLLNNDK